MTNWRVLFVAVALMVVLPCWAQQSTTNFGASPTLIGYAYGFPTGYLDAGRLSANLSLTVLATGNRRNTGQDFLPELKKQCDLQLMKLSGELQAQGIEPAVRQQSMAGYKQGWEDGALSGINDFSPMARRAMGGAPPSQWEYETQMRRRMEAAVYEFATRLGLTPGDAARVIANVHAD